MSEYLSFKNIILTFFGLLLSNSLSAFELQNELSSYMSESRQFVDNYLTLDNCETEVSKFNSIYENLKTVQWESFKDQNQASKIIKSSFYLRLSLRNRFLNLSQLQLANTKCENEVRRMNVNLRFMEEYLAKNAKLQDDVEVFKGTEPYLLVNPKFPQFALQSGDVVISRGNSVVSAAIAQIGDQKGHFSHAALIYKDENTNKIYAIEAHIEIGSDVSPIEEGYLNDGKVRAIVYRHKNSDLAKTAAFEMFQRVIKAKTAKKAIAYNFSMNLAEEKTLFCSQIPFAAFKMASAGNILLGKQYQTRLSGKVQSFLKGIGVNVAQTYSPSDVEFDNQLELVAEWRDFSRAHQTHRKDAVMNRIYHWVEKGEEFDLSKKNAELMLIQMIRNMPLFKYLIEGSIAPNITSLALSYMMVMNYVGDKILDELISRYEKFYEKNQKYMDMQDMLQALEEEKQKDLQRLKFYNHWKIENPGCENESNHCIGVPEKPHFIDYFLINKKMKGKKYEDNF